MPVSPINCYELKTAIAKHSEPYSLEYAFVQQSNPDFVYASIRLDSSSEREEELIQEVSVQAVRNESIVLYRLSCLFASQPIQVGL